MLMRTPCFPGVIQSHTSLKHHTSNLEETLAQKESSIVELDSSVQSELAKSQRQQADLTERLEILEETLTKERENLTEIKEKVGNMSGWIRQGCPTDALSHQHATEALNM